MIGTTSCPRTLKRLTPANGVARTPVPLAAFRVHSSTRRNAMAVETMEDLFVETLKDIYYAEKQIAL
jgi:hypothetical protein